MNRTEAADRGAERVIVALDAGTTEANLAVIAALTGRARWFKLGMGEYYTAGPRLLEAIAEAGAQVFLDLKLHDIPRTVHEAARALAPLRPAMTTVHASGGAEMVAAATEGFAAAGAETIVLAVTVLTSLDDPSLSELGFSAGAAQTATRLGEVALSAGARGLVCSPHEVAALRARYPQAVLVTPGIRPAGEATHDQRRVATPAMALQAGASYLVVGRPIWTAADPTAAFDRICVEAGNAIP